MGERSDSTRSGRASGPSEDVSDATTLGWNEEHRCYLCRDRVALEVRKRTAIWYARDEYSEIPCEKLFIGKMRFSRDMVEIIESKDCIRTITFPLTVRVVR